jgi:hypothetical protein
MRPETKRGPAGPVRIKDAARGEAEAVIATLGVVDHDGDVTLPGAFPIGGRLFISEWNHSAIDRGTLPVGTGTIRVEGTRVLVDVQYFLDTERGRAAFDVVRQLGPLAEWSYGYTVTGQRYGRHDDQPVTYLTGLDVYEASPVYRGAGIGTGTVSTRGRTPDEQVRAEYRRFCRTEQRIRERAATEANGQRAELLAIRDRVLGAR